MPNNKKTTKESKRKKLTREEKFKVIEILLKVMELFAASSLIMMNIGVIENSFNEILTVVENTNISTTDNSTTNIYEKSIVDEDMDEQTLLGIAQTAYESKDYETVVQVYSMEKLKNNALVNNNMGYMYANGIYFDVNIVRADMYFDKAIELGNENAFYNKLAMHFRLRQGDLIELLIQGYELEKNEVIIEFVSCHFEDYPNYTQEEKERVTESFLFEISEEVQNELLEKFYCWERMGDVYLSYSPENTDLMQYIKFTEHSGVKDGVAYTVKGYRKYVKKCFGIERLGETWEYN